MKSVVIVTQAHIEHQDHNKEKGSCLYQLMRMTLLTASAKTRFADTNNNKAMYSVEMSFRKDGLTCMPVNIEDTNQVH